MAQKYTKYVTFSYDDGVRPVSYTHLDVYKRQDMPLIHIITINDIERYVDVS